MVTEKVERPFSGATVMLNRADVYPVAWKIGKRYSFEKERSGAKQRMKAF